MTSNRPAAGPELQRTVLPTVTACISAHHVLHLAKAARDFILPDNIGVVPEICHNPLHVPCYKCVKKPEPQKQKNGEKSRAV
jgi:hypothetical protein